MVKTNDIQFSFIIDFPIKKWTAKIRSKQIQFIKSFESMKRSIIFNTSIIIYWASRGKGNCMVLNKRDREVHMIPIPNICSL